MEFAPIHIISCYSFLKSGLTLEKIISSVVNENYYGAAITDEGFYGIPDFIKLMEQAKKPYLVGIELKLGNDLISAYCTNETGYRNLIKLNTLAQKNDLSIDTIRPHKSGVVGIIETVRGSFKDNFEDQNRDIHFNSYLNEIAKCFDDFYLGIEVTSKDEVIYANKVREFANEFTYKCIAFPRISYAKKEDAIILKMVKAIENNEKITEKEEQGRLYFMSEDNFKKIYSKTELENTVKLVNLSTFNFHEKRGKILSFPVEDSRKYLLETCNATLKEKNLFKEPYLERLDMELKTIDEMGYNDYFLIVGDYVKHAKDIGIVVGPGRGSAAGCLVSYLLGITQIDPIPFGLQFERFLNKGRKSMPDIDVDFMDIRRDEMVDYMREKYGYSRVGNIVTFQTIQAKQAMRDIGRIYDFHDFLITNLSKAIPNTFKDITLRDAYKKIPAFKALVDSDKYYLDIVKLASKIEGMPRQTGVHPSGVILNDNNIDDVLPISLDIVDNISSEYDMTFIEEQGFLKMDFLALRNLTIIDDCIKLINSRHNTNLTPYTIPYDDPKTYGLISKQKTMGLFQIESAGMKRAIKILNPSSFEEIVVLISLFRPGPMHEIQHYADCKNGKIKPTYISKDVESILGETYGVLVYQEQVNNIARVMASLSLSEADLFRRGVSKKDAKVLKEMESKFKTGSRKNGYKEKDVNDMYNLILKFASYGFNKSHAVGYAIIACEMAYLKAAYPLEFYSCILKSSASTSDVKFAEYVSEMKSMGLYVLLPDINKSTRSFMIYDNGLLYPLSEIRGINVNVVDNILKDRNENGEFKSFFEFTARMKRYSITENILDHLIDAGTFDCFNPSRASLRATIGKALQYADLVYNEDGQLTLDSAFVKEPTINTAEDIPLENINREYETLGIMLKDNPLSYKKDVLNTKKVSSIADAIETTGNINVAGIIKTKKIINTKKGQPMAFIKIFDDSGEMEVTLFSDLYSQVIPLIERNKIVIIKGSNKFRNGEYNFIANNVELLEE